MKMKNRLQGARWYKCRKLSYQCFSRKWEIG